MKKFMIAATTAIALAASVGAAGAQTFQNDGPTNYRGRTMIDRNVGLQTAPANAGWNRGWTRNQPAGSAYESRAFRSQEVWPQSPSGRP